MRDHFHLFFFTDFQFDSFVFNSVAAIIVQNIELLHKNAWCCSLCMNDECGISCSLSFCVINRFKAATRCNDYDLTMSTRNDGSAAAASDPRGYLHVLTSK